MRPVQLGVVVNRDGGHPRVSVTVTMSNLSRHSL